MPGTPGKSFLLKGLCKSALKVVLLLFVVLAGIITYNTVTFTSLQCDTPRVTDHYHSSTQLTADELAQRLSKAVQIPTISFEDRDKINATTFEELHALLKELFPLSHHYLKLEIINKYSLVFKWDGQDTSKAPIMLYAHLDVVPVDDAPQWTYPPFEGRVADGFIWGRGAMDAKHQVLGILEGVEALLHQQYKPQRTMYFAFGHDEEISGHHGAKYIAEYFKKQKVSFEYILDEGLVIMRPGMFPGITTNIGVIGIAEKGFITLEVSVNGTGGHASMPPPRTSIGTISRAITRLEDNPHPPSLLGAGPMLDFLGRETPVYLKAVFANLWIFKGAIYKIFAGKPTLNSFIRTTTAVTIIEGGFKSNVLPKHVRAMVNHRVAPHQKVADVLAYDTKVIDDPEVHLRVVESLEASPISDPHAYGFKVIQHTIMQLFDDTVVAPGIMIANTDSRWFWDLTPNIYRFSPLHLSQPDLVRLHGRDERISVVNYQKTVDFYYHLLRNSDSPHY